MKNRLIHLRKELLKITRKEIAEKIRKTEATYGRYETGEINPPDDVIANICEKFNVEEKWLRTGKEPIFKEISEIEKMKKTIDEVMESKSEFQRNALYVLATMSEEEWDLIEKMYYKIKQHSKDKADL